MRLFFNSASFIGQAANLHLGGALLTNMMHAVEYLVEIGASDRSMYRDDSVANRRVVDGKTFKEAVDFRYRQIKDQEAAKVQALETSGAHADLTVEYERFSRFISYLSQSPYASEVFAKHEFECMLDQEDMRYNAIGYTAHFSEPIFEGTGATAVAVSLEGCERFAMPSIEVMYARGDRTEPRSIWNVTTGQAVTRAMRTYQPHGKHDRSIPTIGVRDAEIDLDPEEAQRVLHRAVQLPGENRLFARHKGRLYIFPLHYQDEDKHLYHGFRIEPDNLRARDAVIYSQLRKHFAWDELQ